MIDRGAAAKALGDDLGEAKRIRERARKELGPQRALLRAWSRARMRELHACALADPATSAACSFFLAEVYPGEPQPWRDSQALAALPTLARLLPEPALRALGMAAELDLISERADEMSCRRLAQLGEPAPGAAPGSPISDALGRSCMVLAGRPDRERQIELMSEAGFALRELAGSAIARGALSAMRLPARIAGLSDLQGFLERGLAAFESLRDPPAFIRGLAAREREDLALAFDGAEQASAAGGAAEP